MVVVLSQSPSRKQALKVLLVIIQKDLPVFHVSEFVEIPALLDAHPTEIQVLILDNWMQQAALIHELRLLMDAYPTLRTITLLKDGNRPKWIPMGDQHRVLVGNFDPNEFLQLVREFLSDQTIQSGRE